MPILENCEPKKVFEYFEYLSSVPHGSGNTKKVSDLCVRFAKEHDLEYYQDKYNNVVIYKPATSGYENADTIVLQGHLDMVCAKAEDDPRDMASEPVELATDGKYVFAKGTSLGGDNIVAVAIALAILDDDTLQHPALEALFTVDEETEMLGASTVDPSVISGRKLINIDSEEEGVFTVSCAGGIRADSRIPANFEGTGKNDVCLKIVLDGLLGGHSGCDIEKERGSTHALMCRMLYSIFGEMNIRVSKLYGGKFDNVIPSKTTAEVVCDRSDSEKLKKLVCDYTEMFANELKASDPGIRVSVEEAGLPEKVCDTGSTERMLRAVIMLPIGVINRSYEVEGLTDTSMSVGVMKLDCDGLYLGVSIRSAKYTRKMFNVERVKAIMRSVGGSVTLANEYPGWEFRSDSSLRKDAERIYEELTGKKPVIAGTHGGLECGILSSRINGLDCLSLGPELYDVHSVRERLDIASTGRLYELIKEILKRSK